MTTAVAGSDELLTPEETARRLNISVQTLSSWRTSGRYGLRFVRVGRRVRYRVADVDAWLESRTVEADAQNPE